MTREEAKRRLLNIERCIPIHTREDVRDFEALEMAIKALERESCEDAISRQAVKDRLHVLVSEMEAIFSDIREKNVDDSVCGLCEYDCDHGADGYANECPGFERDDCFKLKDEYRKEWESIKDLPSVKPEAEWIPVSERLPEEDTNVLCWYEYFRYGNYNKMYQTYGVGTYLGRFGWAGDITGEKARVIAWMPLPEPYKGERNDKE